VCHSHTTYTSLAQSQTCMNEPSTACANIRAAQQLLRRRVRERAGARAQRSGSAHEGGRLSQHGGWAARAQREAANNSPAAEQPPVVRGGSKRVGQPEAQGPSSCVQVARSAHADRATRLSCAARTPLRGTRNSTDASASAGAALPGACRTGRSQHRSARARAFRVAGLRGTLSRRTHALQRLGRQRPRSARRGRPLCRGRCLSEPCASSKHWAHQLDTSAEESTKVTREEPVTTRGVEESST
jgi:hypothetical protein